MLSTTLPRLIRLVSVAIAALVLALPSLARAEDGFDLWLRYRPVEQPWRARYAPHATAIVPTSQTATVAAAAAELRRGIGGMLGTAPGSGLRDGAIILEERSLPALGSGGYVIRSERSHGYPVTVIAAASDAGLLYGSFALLRRMQTRAPIDRLDVRDSPVIALRMLDHWDNLDGTVERGYAGPSLWDWRRLPEIDPRMIDYARANASIGVNAVVLNNVNADARILTPDYLRKVAALADAWRPYGIRIYLSARFSAPMDLGHLPTADPVDLRVRAWWQAKAGEIYRLVPDFGGFLVKANSEGQPGPQAYGRTHADGANMFADALAPHGGTVIWRAFVYSGASGDDRAKQAFAEFHPLDGRFRRNVILQVKNGPIDFQPREPFHPLFGAMPATRLALEVQATKEYLGESTHLAWLGTMWSEVLRSRTARPRPSSKVADSLSAMAGVANIGSDRNWTGSDFDQANWYAFGRLAWDPVANPQAIAEEWTRMTWGSDPRIVGPVVRMMLESREAVVDYMTPLGLAHQMASDHHYGPGPWVDDQPAPLWNPTYYNRAEAGGIGFDRTATGGDAIAQYAPQVARCWRDLRCVPDKYLLWFHHVPWTYRMRSGRSLWDELVAAYDRGVTSVAPMQAGWRSVKPFVDRDRYAAVAAKLDRQHLEARWWRDASIAYFQSVSHMPLPANARTPAHDLSWYKAIHFDTVPGFLAPGSGRQQSCVPPIGGPPCAL
jgi:alpha-glucuronidase